MMFQKFFSWGRKPITSVPNPSFDAFMGAGCVFTDGKHVLAGYQPHKKYPCITGIGGHKEAGETYYETAMRETIEEIYHVSVIPPQLISTLLQQLPPRKEENHLNYIILTYTFEDLKKFLYLCKKSRLQSPLYRKLPLTLMECIRNRNIELEAEITHLCLLPVIKDFKGKQFVHPAFLQDMKNM